MIKTFVTLVAIVVCGISFAYNDYMASKKKYKKNILKTKSLENNLYNQLYYDRSLLQRRGAWRFGVNNLLFYNELLKNIKEESNIKLK
ncbi:hypothetical protein [Thomasclavelia cocleata]|jgi:hypothetical protein|uniref:hypothetical protein n=1 Tax=Thomasclavelia cocleata TaxID=69824 RepID=UPI00272E10CD|nr:hypothetical protein [Thomasclavelia cocleata]